MFKNNLAIAFRQLGQRPVYSIILIGGLTIGLAAALLVSTLVINDLSFDQQWSKKDRIFRVITKGTSIGEEVVGCQAGLLPVLKKTEPEVEDYCRMNRNDIHLRFNEDPQGVALNSLDAEPTIWNFLDLNILEGNPKQEVSGYDNLLITESVRKRFFANKNPVGMQIHTVNSYDEGDTLLITGVISDLPENSHLKADVIVLRHFSEGNNVLSGPGAGNFLHAYVLLKPRTDLKRFTSKINSWFNKEYKAQQQTEFIFQPITDVYLRSKFSNERSELGDIRRVYILSGVAILLLVIVCINFINLSTAAALRRAKGTSIRKVMGAGKIVLLKQYMTESMVCFFIGFSLAILLYLAALPALESFTKSSLPLGITKQWYVFAAAFFVVFVITILTGFYPAWVLSRPKAILSFNISGKGSDRSDILRKALVCVQFAISIILLISTAVVQRQVQYLNNTPLGYEKNNLLVMFWMNWGEKADAFRNSVSEISGVQSVSIVRWIPAGSAGSMTSTIDDPEHPDKKMIIAYISGDSVFSKTLGLRLIKGRGLNSGSRFDAPDFEDMMRRGKMDSLELYQSVLLTESTARRLGVKELGRHIKGLPGIPVGIIADFKNESLKSPEGLCGIEAESPSTYGGMLIRVAPGSELHVKRAADQLFKKFYPSLAQEYQPASKLLAAQYDSETRLMKVFFFFSSLIVFLSCMGLLGLVIFMVQARVKEIGIRKVLGASVQGLTVMFTWSFLKLVVISGFIAVPVGWLMMNRWLEDYPNRIDLNAWLFVLPVSISILVALLTVGLQSVRAAMANPTDALRNE